MKRNGDGWRWLGSTTIAQYILPPLVGRFLIVHPRVDPFLSGANTEAVVSASIEKLIDLALIEGPAHRADFKLEPFLSDEIVTIVPPQQEWIEQWPALLARDLEKVPLIMRERVSGVGFVSRWALKKERQLGTLGVSRFLGSAWSES